jgi:small subunit ribosomal protein S2
MFLNTSLTIEETAKGLFLAAKILRNGGRLLIVDTRGDISPFLKVIENKVDMIPSAISFSGCRWVGGTVSNWKKISRAVSCYVKILPLLNTYFLYNERVTSRYRKMIDAYPGFLEDKEEKLIPRLYNFKIKKKWGHKKIRFTRHPDLIFIVNPNDSRHIIDEANGLKIPVIALVDSDSNLDGIKIPIPVNYDTTFWVYHCINTLIRLANFVQKTDLPFLQPYPIKEQRPFPPCPAPWNKRERIKRKQ